MDNSIIYDNTAIKGNGGAVYIHVFIRSYSATNSSSSITRCHFINNAAGQGSGGAIYKSIDMIGANELVLLNQTYFSNNTAA